MKTIIWAFVVVVGLVVLLLWLNAELGFPVR